MNSWKKRLATLAAALAVILSVAPAAQADDFDPVEANAMASYYVEVGVHHPDGKRVGAGYRVEVSVKGGCSETVETTNAGVGAVTIGCRPDAAPIGSRARACRWW